jgi:hypothetical protein
LDGPHHVVEASIDLEIPEAEGLKPGAPEDRIAHGVVIGLRIVGVLTPVHLDDEALLETNEVEIEAEQRRLTTKVETVAPQSSELHP